MAVHGYPKLASHISTAPSSLITRSFASLAARNILYLQAELVHLEIKLQELESRDSTSPVGKKEMFAKDWYWLQSSGTEAEGEQWATVLEIRGKLKEYHDAVLQQAGISTLPQPLNHDLHALQDWLERPTMGNFALVGEDRKVWGYTDRSVATAFDLISVNPASPKDPFSNWVIHFLVRWFHHHIRQRIQKPSDEESGMLVYEEETVLGWTGRISTAVASLLPIISTVVLYFVSNTGLRLGLTAVFTLLFTVALMAFTKVRGVEVFVATAAFAAVEVVFISGNPL